MEIGLWKILEEEGNGYQESFTQLILQNSYLILAQLSDNIKVKTRVTSEKLCSMLTLNHAATILIAISVTLSSFTAPERTAFVKF